MDAKVLNWISLTETPNETVLYCDAMRLTLPVQGGSISGNAYSFFYVTLRASRENHLSTSDITKRCLFPHLTQFTPYRKQTSTNDPSSKNRSFGMILEISSPHQSSAITFHEAETRSLPVVCLVLFSNISWMIIHRYPRGL